MIARDLKAPSSFASTAIDRIIGNITFQKSITVSASRIHHLQPNSYLSMKLHLIDANSDCDKYRTVLVDNTLQYCCIFLFSSENNGDRSTSELGGILAGDLVKTLNFGSSFESDITGRNETVSDVKLNHCRFVFNSRSIVMYSLVQSVETSVRCM